MKRVIKLKLVGLAAALLILAFFGESNSRAVEASADAEITAPGEMEAQPLAACSPKLGQCGHQVPCCAGLTCTGSSARSFCR